MNRNQVSGIESILVDSQYSGSAKINNTISFNHTDYFAHPIKLGTRTIINEVAQSQVVGCPSVIRIDHRQTIEPVW